MQRCFDKQEMVYGSTTRWFALPLRVEVGGQTHRTGVFAVQLMRQKPDEEDTLLVELVVDYLAAVLYNAVVRVRRKYNDIELAQDDARRALYEENMLHVQNLVLDNCLSTIKHETVYYPNRMKQIIDRLDAGSVLSEAEEQEQLQTVDELVSYYKDILVCLVRVPPASWMKLHFGVPKSVRKTWKISYAVIFGKLPASCLVRFRLKRIFLPD